jgi:hypothetical protein
MECLVAETVLFHLATRTLCRLNLGCFGLHSR